MKLPHGIRQRGNSYVVDVTVKGIRRTATTILDLDTARSVHADLRAALLRTAGSDIAHHATWTLKQCLEKTTSIAWRDQKSRVGLIRNAEMVVSILGPATPLPAITVEKIDELVQVLQDQGNSNGTVNRKLAALSKMLTFAYDRDKLIKKPKITRGDEAEHRIRFLTPDEEGLCLSTLALWSKHDHADVLTVLIDTGLRESELWRVTRQDVDERVINIWQSKGRLARSVPMTARVASIILQRSQSPGPLFPYNKNWFTRGWDKMKSHIGLHDDKQFVPYALRHTCASRLIQRGVPLKHAQEWLGHNNITTTMRYAHLCPTSLLDAVKVLEVPVL